MALEVEDKFDVPPGFLIPDMSRVPDCAVVAGPRSYRMVALYFDTPDLRLAARGITLRRRRGGDDAGWHLKLPKVKGAREEIAVPLTRSVKVVPPEIADLVLAYSRREPLVPVAELATRREVTVLRDAEGRDLVEIADDSVKGTVYGQVFGGEERVERWREVEAELKEGELIHLKRAGKALRKAGAAPAASGSKLGRLLGDAVPVSELAGPPEDTAGRVVIDYLKSQVDALTGQDPQVRREAYDAVHQMRVASRRLRSAMKSFDSVVAETDDLQEELRWIAGVLGEARDLEVIHERFGKLLGTLAPDMVVGPVRVRLDEDLLARHREALVRVDAAMRSERYYSLLDRLDALVANPPLTPLAMKKADKVLDKVAVKSWMRVVKKYDTAQSMEDPDKREVAMHDVRKAAKRARYTAEALKSLLGDRATAMAKRAKTVQEVLGLHQDGVVAQEILSEEAARARAAGEDTFTYGVLVGLEHAEAKRSHEEFPRVWAEAQS
ncbi:CYTH and CHAD domain-containing protein [Sphaerisporangium sp. B11E5]|uniref:CYTH and CHAD domain-containing protein n=1 Tax=Sphaerisporangium sp. B11E5 TaxID=3153563 RepID=UPI00325DAB5B